MRITSLASPVAARPLLVARAPTAVNPAASTAVSSYKTSGLAKAVVIQDTAANIQANWSELKALANAGKISAFKLTDSTKPTLALKASDMGKDSAALLGKISAVALVKVSDTSANIATNLNDLQAQSAKLLSIEQSGTKAALGITVAQLKSASAALAKIDGGAYTLSVSGVGASTLAGLLANAKVTSLSVTDTSGNIAANLSALNGAGNKLSSITQSGTKAALSITAAQLNTSAATLAKIDGNTDTAYTLSVVGAQTSQLSSLANNAKVTAFSLIDSAANVTATLTDLKANSTKLKAIALTDTSPVLSVKVDDLTSAAGVLAKITSKFTYQIADSSANINAALDTLQAKVKSIASLTLTDTSRPTLSVTATQYKNSAAVLAKISGAALSVKLSGNYADYKLKVNTDGSFAFTDSQKRTDESNTFKGVNFFEFKNFTAFGDTGDANLNALLSGGTNFWWANGTGAKASDTQVKAGVYGLDASSAKREFTYSFMRELPSTATAQDKKGFAEMTNTQKAAVVDAFTYLSSLINVTFTLSDSATGTADINFGTNNQANSAGYANPPNGSGDHPVFLMLDKASTSNQSFSYGSYGWQTVIHEIGHTLGLKHPGNYNAGGGGTPGPYLPKATDNSRFSVMSYTPATDASKVTTLGNGYSYSGMSPSTFMTYDIAALQYIYGANTSSNTNTTHQSLSFSQDWQGFQTVWTAKGGTLDASAMTRANIIDLRQGAYSSIGVQTLNNGKSKITFGMNNVGLAYGSYLDTVKGGAAGDAFFVDASNIKDTQTIDGGAGSDIAYLNGKASDWTISDWNGSSDTSGTATNSLTKKIVTLSNIENIKYYDSKAYATIHSAIDLNA
ncbi:Serralysin-like metallopeptidase domain [Burkholderiaceae bacterium]